MANVTLTIPDAALPRVTAALCNAEGLADTNANAKIALTNYIKRTVKAYEALAKETVKNNAIIAATNTYSTDIKTIQANVDAIVIT